MFADDDGHVSTDYVRYNFSWLDFVMVAAVLVITAVIGFYYVWQAQMTKNTREFLVANKGISLCPLILSASATALSSSSLLGIPMESYCNGVQMSISVLAYLLGTIMAAYSTVPVLYNLNVNTTNQYVEYRFNRFLRIVPAIIFLLQNSFTIAAVTYVTALVLTQATGLNIWFSISLIAGLCIVYSSLGGFAAVIWTDVFQMLVIFAAYATMLVKGTIDSGGVTEIWEQNRLGHRTTFFYWTSSPLSNYTVWSIVMGNLSLGFLLTATSQSSLQRQLANRDLNGARKTVLGTVFITKALSLTSVWIGMTVYAKYHDCDPYLANLITSRDQVTAAFAMDIFDKIPGLSGLYVGGILCATLSTLSSIVNAFATIILIDFIKPLLPKVPDSTSRLLSKAVGGLYGLLIFGLTGYAKNFGSIVQTLQAISGTSLGSTGVVYILGFFVPWANSKGTTIGYLISLLFGWWLSIGRMLIGNPYTTAPMTTQGCSGQSLNITRASLNGSNFFIGGGGGGTGEFEGPADVFIDENATLIDFAASDAIMDESISSIIETIIPLWFSLITIIIGLVIGILASIMTGSKKDVENVDINLISPFTIGLLRYLPESVCRRIGVLHLLCREKKKFLAPDQSNVDLTQLNTPNGLQIPIIKDGFLSADFKRMENGTTTT